MGPTPTSDFPESQTPTCQGSRPLAPRNSGAGHPGSWPPLHHGDPNTLHWRLPPVPHYTLRPPHPSAGGNARRPEIVGQLDMQEPGNGDHWGQLPTGCEGNDTRAPASATPPGEAGAGSIEITAFLGGGARHAPSPPGAWSPAAPHAYLRGLDSPAVLEMPTQRPNKTSDRKQKSKF